MIVSPQVKLMNGSLQDLPYPVFDGNRALSCFLEHLASKLDAAIAVLLDNHGNILSTSNRHYLQSLETKTFFQHFVVSCSQLIDKKPISKQFTTDDSFMDMVGQCLFTHDSENNKRYLIFVSHEVSIAHVWESAIMEWFRTNGTTASIVIHALLDVQHSVDINKHCFDIISPDDEQQKLLNNLTTIFEAYLLKKSHATNTNNGDDDLWQSKGSIEFRKQLYHYTAVFKPILFILPGFPYKSSNTKTKVLGELPDMAEKLGLQRLEKFLFAVRDIYKPGALLVIFSDGRIYCDLVPISDEITLRFSAAVRQLHPSSVIFWSDLNHFFPGLGSDQKRMALENLFGTDEKQLPSRIQDDKDFEKVHKRFVDFGKEERTDLSREPKELETIASRRMMRNWAYGVMVKCFFPDHIRLSIHPSMNTEKFSINLVGETVFETPWHNCAVAHSDGSWSLIRRCEAEERGYKLCISEDGLPYFVANKGGPAIPSMQQ